jgi:hypothetical protein
LEAAEEVEKGVQEPLSPVCQPLALYHQDRLDEGIRLLEATADDFEVLDDPMNLFIIRHNIIMFHCENGDVAKAASLLQEWGSLYRRLAEDGAQIVVAQYYWISGKIYSRLGRFQLARQKFFAVSQPQESA